MKVEIKKDNEAFKPFDKNNVYYKVTLWKKDIKSLHRDDLKY